MGERESHPTFRQWSQVCFLDSWLRIAKMTRNQTQTHLPIIRPMQWLNHSRALSIMFKQIIRAYYNDQNIFDTNIKMFKRILQVINAYEIPKTTLSTKSYYVIASVASHLGIFSVTIVEQIQKLCSELNWRVGPRTGPKGFLIWQYDPLNF